jgi:hypothetical protein
MRLRARLTCINLTLFRWGRATSWTPDRECLFWAEFFFHAGGLGDRGVKCRMQKACSPPQGMTVSLVALGITLSTSIRP